jgi:hypothetical protein
MQNKQALFVKQITTSMFQTLSLVLLVTAISVRFEVLKVLLLKIQVFSDMTLCHWAGSSRCSEGLWCLHLQIKFTQQHRCHIPENSGIPL